jgi:glycosyltransferase involved in cell wall biosynthesis
MKPPLSAYFISYRVNEQLTGGEKFNWGLIEAARKEGINIVVWEGRNTGKNIILANLNYLIKCFSISKPCFVILDIDYCARFLFGLLWLKSIRHIPIIGVVFHYKFTFQQRWLRKIPLKFIEALSSRAFTVLITISQYSLTTFNTISRKKIRSFVIPPFVKSTPEELPTERRNGPKSPLRLITVGAIDPRKNIHTLIRSLKYLNFPYHLDVVGHKQSLRYYNTLQKMLDEFGIRNMCTFHGFLEKDALNELLLTSDVFVLVSEMEGYGMAFAEAMKFGLPIIASNRGAIPELIFNKENGFLCEPDYPMEIADAISRLNEKDIWEKISNANEEKYKTLMDRKTFVRKCEQVFSEIRKDLLFAGD